MFGCIYHLQNNYKISIGQDVKFCFATMKSFISALQLQLTYRNSYTNVKYKSMYRIKMFVNRKIKNLIHLSMVVGTKRKSINNKQ